MIIAKHRHAGIPDPVQRLQRLPEIARAGVGPGGDQRGRDVFCPTRVAGDELGARDDPLAVADRANRERQSAHTVPRILRHEPLGESISVDRVAVGERGGEGMFEQIDIARVGSQGFAVIERRGAGIAIRARHQRVEIVPGLRLPYLVFRPGGRRRRIGCG